MHQPEEITGNPKLIYSKQVTNSAISYWGLDHGLLEDVQEAFLKDHSTQRQQCKLQCLLAAQCKAKSLSVMLFLDI